MEICLYFIRKFRDQFWGGNEIVKEAGLGRRRGSTAVQLQQISQPFLQGVVELE